MVFSKAAGNLLSQRCSATHANRLQNQTENTLRQAGARLRCLRISVSLYGRADKTAKANYIYI